MSSRPAASGRNERRRKKPLRTVVINFLTPRAHTFAAAAAAAACRPPAVRRRDCAAAWLVIVIMCQPVETTIVRAQSLGAGWRATAARSPVAPTANRQLHKTSLTRERRALAGGRRDQQCAQLIFVRINDDEDGEQVVRSSGLADSKKTSRRARV